MNWGSAGDSEVDRGAGRSQSPSKLDARNAGFIVDPTGDDICEDAEFEHCIAPQAFHDVHPSATPHHPKILENWPELVEIGPIWAEIGPILAGMQNSEPSVFQTTPVSKAWFANSPNLPAEAGANLPKGWICAATAPWDGAG